MTIEFVAVALEILLAAAVLVLLRRLMRKTYRGMAFVLLKALGISYVTLLLMIAYLRYHNPPITAIELQRSMETGLSGTPIGLHRYSLPLDSISSHVLHAAIVGEDPNFFSHDGVDWEAVRVKNWLALRTGSRFVGASTITQQLTKNLFLCGYRSYLRKGVELTIVPLVEGILPKERILELYLNIVEWGDGIYGIEAAARHYYGVSAHKINRTQAARLVAVLPNPRYRRPFEQNYTSGRILQRMGAMGW